MSVRYVRSRQGYDTESLADSTQVDRTRRSHHEATSCPAPKDCPDFSPTESSPVRPWLVPSLARQQESGGTFRPPVKSPLQLPVDWFELANRRIESFFTAIRREEEMHQLRSAPRLSVIKHSVTLPVPQSVGAVSVIRRGVAAETMTTTREYHHKKFDRTQHA